MKSKVYIINKSHHNFSLAEKLGDLVFITQGRIDARNYNEHARKFMEAAEEYDPEKDYLLVTSLQVLNLQFGWALGLLGKDLRILYFDAKVGDYLVFTIKNNSLKEQ